MKTKKILSMLLACAALIITACNKPAEVTENAEAKNDGNKDCLKKVFTMFETGNIEGIENCVAENMIEHSPAPMIKTTGLQGMKDIIAMHHGAFPDTKIEVLDMWQDGDKVVAHYRMTGTNTGAMGEMPATNKAMDVNGVDIVRFENGKGVEHWGYWEESKMMTQLGLMPPEGGAPADTSGRRL